MNKAAPFLLCAALASAITPNYVGAAGPKSIMRILTSNSARSNFQVALNNYLVEKADKAALQGNPSADGSAGTKSVGKAVLLSAALPGTGQIYSGSYFKGAALLLVEAVSLAGHFHFQGKGEDLEVQYEGNADQQWNEEAYWAWIEVVSGLPGASRSELRVYERDAFSHFLPENKNQQYYENIGKYDQFVAGWDDFREGALEGDVSMLSFQDYTSGSYQGEDLTTISPDRNAYVELRRDSNDHFKRATNLVTLAILNHVVSALDAGFTAKRRNQRVMSANLRMHGMIHNDSFIPALTLGLKW